MGLSRISTTRTTTFSSFSFPSGQLAEVSISRLQIQLLSTTLIQTQRAKNKPLLVHIALGRPEKCASSTWSPSYSWDLEGGIAPEVSPGSYKNSVETIVRNEIQQQKIEMASEIIDAGRFDMNTTNDERKQTLEKLLDDYDQHEDTTNHVPSLVELNELLARTPAELELFNRMDREMDWPVEAGSEPVEDWLLYRRDEFLQVQRDNRGRKKVSQLGIPDAEAGEDRTQNSEAFGLGFQVAPGIDPAAILTGPRVRITRCDPDFSNIDEELLEPNPDRKSSKSKRTRDLSVSLKIPGQSRPKSAAKPAKKGNNDNMSLGDYEVLLQQYKSRQQTGATDGARGTSMADANPLPSS